MSENNNRDEDSTSGENSGSLSANGDFLLDSAFLGASPYCDEENLAAVKQNRYGIEDRVEEFAQKAGFAPCERRTMSAKAAAMQRAGGQNLDDPVPAALLYKDAAVLPAANTTAEQPSAEAFDLEQDNSAPTIKSILGNI